MYPSRGNNAYGQQSYGGGQSGYAQNLGTAYSGSSVGGLDAASQQSLASRHSSMLGASQEADAGGYRGHASAAAHYGGQFGSTYGSAGISGAQQASAMTTKGSGSLVMEGRGGYSSGVTSSPKFAPGEYVPTSHGYGPKSDQLYAEKIPDYPSVDRRQYDERQSAYIGRDMQGDPAARYADSVGFGHHRQPEMYERIDQAAMLRQEKLLKSQSMQSASLDGGTRQIDYLAARSAANRHPAQDLASYGGRIDADPRSASLLSSSTYAGQNTPSILGAAPRKIIDDLLYPQSSSNPGYGVSLPPGRDYGTGKGLHATSLEADYAGGHPGIDDRRDDRPSYLREFELREEERRRELLREREKDRERDRERERVRERERERERKRERERMLERREKERERERKRAIEVRRERTPMRASRDRRASSLMKGVRVSHRDSPSHEAAHRRHSPVKEKRREYVCKVHTSSLVDVERDYLSLDKRYPRLFVSPELSKVVVNWPRENFKLSIHTPVSFEHDFAEDEGVAGSNGPATKVSSELHVKPEFRSTVWNAKIILMSGLSKNALEDLSSDRILDDRIPHICNILRFAILKRDHAFMAIGGPCDVGDGGDPAVDDSGLIQTALRYAKDVAQLDLQRCCNWNRFLEIHYDRYGEDGFFSHKEVTVLFVPDLSECLPSLDIWRDQWLAHKKTIADREDQLSLKKERSREKEVQKDKGIDSKRLDKAEKVKVSASSVDNKKEKGENNVKGKAAADKGDEFDEKFEKVVSTGSGEEAKNASKDQVEATVTPKTDSVKTGKKKIIRRIVKQKVDKTADTKNSSSKQNEASHENAGGKNGTSEISVEQSEGSADPSGVKTFVRKKIIKKVPVGKATQNDDKGSQLEAKADREMVCSEDKVKDVSGAAGAAGVAVVQGSGVKTTIKKKIIKRVLKRKLIGAASSGGTSETKDEKKLVVSSTETKDLKQMAEGENQATEVNKPEKKIVRKVNFESPTTEKKSSASNCNTTQGEAGKEEKNESDGKSGSGTKVGKEEKSESDGKGGSGTKVAVKSDKQKVAHNDNHNEKRGKSGAESSNDEKRNRDGKDEPLIKSSKEVKEKREPEEPPRHSGLILQTKGNKETKLRSLSLSLDSLLDYTDKDIEESTFELSLFAETLHEMLQYQMGSRLLTFLQKVRIKFVTKRNQQKRRREETDEKDKEKKPTKHPKTSELPLKINTADVEMLTAESDDKTKLTEESAGQSDDRRNMPEKSADELDGKTNMTKGSSEHINEEKLEEESHDEEDPEEDPEEYEELEDPEEDKEMEDPSHANKIHKDEGNTIADAAQEPVDVDKKDIEEATKVKVAETKAKPVEDSSGKGGVKVETGKKETDVGKEVVVDKELLEAFRFFDRNRTGFIRVEDMRLIIHNLGKLLPHRDVKDLVQSALLMSNTGRDDRILYNKLVKMSGL